MVDTIHVAPLATPTNNDGQYATEVVGIWTVGIVPPLTLCADLLATTAGHC